ncbi:hypothetical protein ACLOJK_018724 [Asimina triloba]
MALLDKVEGFDVDGFKLLFRFSPLFPIKSGKRVFTLGWDVVVIGPISNLQVGTPQVEWIHLCEHDQISCLPLF